ncbi:MAG: DUF3048 domain-containing protein [Patescibacteria group bacterium]|jgi:hypothetical protein
MVIKQKETRNNLRRITISAIVLSVFVVFWAKQALALSAPTILSPKNNQQIVRDQPIIVTGLVANNSSVFIIMDGKVIGGTKIANGKKGTASFRYQSKLKYGPGKHTIQAQAISGKIKSAFTAKITVQVPKVLPSRLNGVMMDSNQANEPPVAVMIENTPEARPQAGLASAGVVYETLAEGGIPRFVALYNRDDMPKVGPVRSARPYYVDWVKEYQGAYMHAGGSYDAFQEIGRLKVRSLDALVSKTAKYFFRTKNAAPHNLYTSGAKMKQAKVDYKVNTIQATYESWKFKNDLELKKRPNEKRQLIVDFKSGAAFIATYKYDKASNSYLRYNGGRPQYDANYSKPTQVKAKNVIVQLIPKEKILDRKKRIQLDITGTGKGYLLIDGKLQNITWKRPNMNYRTKYYYANGKEIELNRGNIWIEVVPKDRTVLYK